MRIIFNLDDETDDVKVFVQTGYVPTTKQLLMVTAAIAEFVTEHDTRCSIECKACNGSLELFNKLQNLMDDSELFTKHKPN